MLLQKHLVSPDSACALAGMYPKCSCSKCEAKQPFFSRKNSHEKSLKGKTTYWQRVNVLYKAIAFSIPRPVGLLLQTYPKTSLEANINDATRCQ